MNEEKKEYIKQWLKKAKDDYDAYRIIIDSEYPLHAIAGFHLQQSSEKYLKAFLEYHEIRFARTHDIEYLLKLCAQISPEFNRLTAAKLTDFAVDLRYPGFMHEPSENELKEALDASLQIQKLVLSLMVF